MKGLRTTLAVAMAAGALTLAGMPAQAGKIVKWVDEKGVTHYGEKAPDGARVVDVKVSDTTSSDADAEIEKLNKTRAAAKSAKEGGNEAGGKAGAPAAGGLDDASRKACDQHRKNLDTLKTGKRVRLLDEQGKPRSLTAEEIQAQVEFAEGELKRCEQIQKIKGGAAAAPAAP